MRYAHLTSILLGAALLALLPGCRSGSTPPPPAATSPCGAMAEVHEVLPDLAFRTLDGGDLKLRDLRGKAVVLDFWAMLCKGCVDGLDHYAADPVFQDASRVHLIAVSADKSEPAVREFVKRKKWPFPVVMISPEARQALFGEGPLVVPQARLLDAEGVLRYRLGLTESDPETVKCLLGQLGVPGFTSTPTP